ncbi:N-acetyltransferase [Streptomyces longispororuber]|uniref:N-acetyltransferase n=1 Tax=Streptomyces longispororuber TaxID=68230 RepID=A0A918ZWE4_9ACTN|nr:GNAT family N-acetyltransferase [Streptomyces longispororuber]GHE73904.1 N-acetyltransferase [Streptomyces longispororuber]
MTTTPGARWHLTADPAEFLDRARPFLHAEPALNTALLTVADTLRTRGPHVYGGGDPLLGWLEERGGRVRGAFLRTPPHRVAVSPLAPGDGPCGPDALDALDALAGELADRSPELPGVMSDRATATAFADAWRRRTGAAATENLRQRLYRLGELTPPEPAPPGAARVATAADRELLVRWHQAFLADLGQERLTDPGEWADARLAYGGVTLWEAPDGTPVSMAGATRLIAGQIRVAPVYTPPEHRARGHAAAVTAEVSRAALAAGAREVLLFTDLANPTSNGLYRRIGYRPVRDYAQFTFTPGR